MTTINPEKRPQNIPLGIGLVIAAALTIATQDVIFKLFSSELTLWQIFALRALMAIPLFVALAFSQGKLKEVFVGSVEFWTLLRGAFFTLTFMAYYAAVPFQSLAILGAANYTAPIFITLISAFIIHEAVSTRGWLGVCIGFAGVLVLLQPGTDAFSYWTLLPLLGAFFYSWAHIITRTKCQSTPLLTMAFSVNLMMLVAGLAMSLVFMYWQLGDGLAQSHPYLFGNWAPVGLEEWLVLGVLAVFTTGIAILLAGAYKAAPPSIVATFEYSYLVFVAVYDFVFFSILLTPMGILGIAMIVGAGILVMRRR